MFSVVTALVSPHVIDVLQDRQEGLATTLSENASVLCVQPSRHVCLLQGEWENVKKAYAILEELYIRVQAERAIEGRYHGDRSAAHRLWPLFENISDETGKSRFLQNGDDDGKHRGYGYPQTSTISQSDSPSERRDSSPSHSVGDPPEINRMASYQSSEPEERTRHESYHDSALSENDEPTPKSPVAPKLTAEHRMTSPGHLEVISDDDDSVEETRAGKSPEHDAYLQGNLAATRAFLEAQRQRTLTGQAPINVSVGLSSSDLSKLTQSYLSTLSTLQQLSPQSKESQSCLPPPSYLLQGPSNGPSFFNYSAMYSQHLSALQNMPVKQEPGTAPTTAVDGPQETASHSTEIKSENHYDHRDSTLPEFKCSHCDKTYRSEARMKEHLKTHDKNYVPVFHSCPKCSKSFTYRHNMIVHLRRFHFGWQPAKRHICRACGMRFQKPYMLRDHEQRAHLKTPDESPAYNCTQCDAIFDNKHALAGHCSKNHNVCVDTSIGRSSHAKELLMDVQDSPDDLSVH